MTLSVAIDDAVAEAEAEGNEVREISTGWTKVREVVHMSMPMSDTLKARIAADNRLRYWTVDGTPYNKPERGFSDDREQVAISFPAS